VYIDETIIEPKCSKSNVCEYADHRVNSCVPIIVHIVIQLEVLAYTHAR